jgi:NADH-quinone oxidoreductase subunit M
MGFITLGIFSLATAGGDGSVIQMFNHGLVVAAVFFIIAFIVERAGTEDIREMGGLAMRAPAFAILFIIVTMALLAIPGSANFVGELFILKGVFETKVAIALIASSGIAFAGFYALRMYQRTMHNRLPDGLVSRELTLREGVVLVPLVLAIVALALYPALITERGEESVRTSLSALCTEGTCPKGVEVPDDTAAFGPGWTGYAPTAEVEP